MQGRVEAGESVALLAEILDPSSALNTTVNGGFTVGRKGVGSEQ